MTQPVQIQQILIKRGNTAAIASYTGPLGELVLNTETNQLVAQDGVTMGGRIVAGSTGGFGNSNVANYIIANQDSIYSNANVASYLPVYSGNAAISQINDLTGNAINLASNNYIQLQYDPTGAYNENDIANGSWLYISSAGLEFQSNVSGNETSVTFGNDGSVTAFGEVTSFTGLSGNVFTSYLQFNEDNSIQTTAYKGPPNQTSFATVESVTGANSAIVTANLALKGYVDGKISLLANAPAILDTLGQIATAIQNDEGNIGTILTNITATNANITAANTKIATLQSQVYSNANVASYLPIYGGNISLGNVTFPNSVSFRVVNPPPTLGGSVGDLVGDIAFDGANIYYCYANTTSTTQITVTTQGDYDNAGPGGVNQLHLGGVPSSQWAGLRAAANIFVRNSSNAYLGTITYYGDLNGSFVFNEGSNNFGSAGNTYWFIPNTWKSTPWSATTYSNVQLAAYLLGNITTGNILPQSNVAYSLGSYSQQWKDLWISGNSIHIGNTALSINNGTLMINGIMPYANSNVTAYLAAGTDTTISSITNNVQTLNANVGSFYTWANTNFGTSNYGNSNVAAYLVANPQGGVYSNANVLSLLGANTIIAIGNVNPYPLQSNITQLFVGNSTTLTSGGAALAGTTYLMNNTYFGANGAPFNRNTQTGAFMLSMGGATGFLFQGATGAITGNTYQALGNYAQLNSSGFVTQNSIGITSAGTLTASGTLAVNGAGGITTTQTTVPVLNTTATTINFGGAATTVALGASTVNLNVGSGAGNISAGNINATQYGNSIGTTATYSGNVTAGNLISSNFLYPNGASILTGISGTYSNTNVAAYLAGNINTGNVRLSSGSWLDFVNSDQNWRIGYNLGSYTKTTAQTTVDVVVGSGTAGPDGFTVGQTNGASIFELVGYTRNAWFANNITAVGNVTAANYLYANGVSILTGIGGTYSNSNVASYLVANPQAGTYSNTNVSAYLTSATIATTGNITGGNLITSGNVTASYIITTGSYGNISQVNTIFANNYVYANGVSILNGIGGTYSNSNVASYLTTQTFYSNSNVAAYLVANPQSGTYSNANVIANLQNLTTNVITSANVQANYFVGNGAALTGLAYASVGNIYGSSSNVTLQAGTYSWTFDNTGNLSIPTNGNIIWANGTVFSSGTGGGGGTNYANANVIAYFGTLTNIALGSGSATGTQSISIGSSAGSNSQGMDAIAIGVSAGQSSQGDTAVAIGPNAGSSSQTSGAVAVGYGAGQTSQSEGAVAVGNSAGQNNQGTESVGVGIQAGYSGQGNWAVAIGSGAATTGQGTRGVAIGNQAGQVSQGTSAIAIGGYAGENNQGTNAIAIGAFAGATSQPANSIVINASGNEIDGTGAGFFVNPVRNDTSNVTNAVYYNTVTSELTYGPAASGSYGNANVAAYLAANPQSGTVYSNANVVSMLSANSIVVLGNANPYPTQSNITQLFIGGNTVITSGGGASGGATEILNNAYWNNAGVLTARNTYSNGSLQIIIDGASLSINAQSSSTANTATGMGSRLSLNSTALSTFNSVGITSSGTLTASGTLAVNGSGGVTTTQTSFPLVNTTATSVQFAGAATTTTIGASTGIVVIGANTGALSAGTIIVNTNFITNGNVTANGGGSVVATGNSYTTGNTYTQYLVTTGNSMGNISGVNNLTAVTIQTTGTYGNITGANVISANSFVFGSNGVNILNSISVSSVSNGSSSLTFATSGGNAVVQIGGVQTTTFGQNQINVTGGIIATANITAANVIANQYGNSVGTSATYTGTVTAANVVASGASGPQMRFEWDTWLTNGNTAINAMTPAGTLTGSSTWDANVSYGIDLTSNIGGQTGSVYWNSSTVNYNNNMTISGSFGAYANPGNAADGYGIFFGSNANITSSTYTNSYGIFVFCHYYTGSNRWEVYVNGSLTSYPFVQATSYAPSGISVWNATAPIFNDITIEIYYYNGKRLMEVYLNNSHQFTQDITSWTPLGNYYGASAYTGGAYSYNLVRSLRVWW